MGEVLDAANIERDAEKIIRKNLPISHPLILHVDSTSELHKNLILDSANAGSFFNCITKVYEQKIKSRA